ncbi:MAG: anthranilate synthase component 1 [Candidatus Accumulibacter sp.]|jgi:anthranilate synthase component 1|nr:anthranilate synthase component 1 [Accumulibacter sp.]
MNKNTETPERACALKRVLPILPDPLASFSALTKNGKAPHTILMESAEPSSRKTQRSMLVVSSALLVVCRGAFVEITALNGEGSALLPRLFDRFSAWLVVETPKGSALRLKFPLPRDARDLPESERLKIDSTLSVLRGLLALLREDLPDFPEALFLSGVFAYDLVDQFEPLPEAEAGNDFPDYQFILADQMVVIDPLEKTAYALACSFGASNAATLNRRLDFIEEGIAESALAPCAEFDARGATAGASVPVGTSNLLCDSSDLVFAAKVKTLKEHILAGDVFQIVASRTFFTPCEDAFAAYCALRSINPSPYLFYMNGGGFILFGASPESAVKVEGGARSISISPIAGTAPRGFFPDGRIDADLDGRLEAELRLNEKENAEHMMLVDLARNDVARVSKPGTRAVGELLRTERYSHVMHLVSRVTGTLRDDLDALHAYQASMNMGTLTGAPKIRAMQLLREHEGKRRGHYGGAIGYLRGDGSFDTAIVIRAALVENGTASVRAGAGVVHDSVPILEADETRRKAEAVLRAIVSTRPTPT